MKKLVVFCSLIIFSQSTFSKEYEVTIKNIENNKILKIKANDKKNLKLLIESVENFPDLTIASIKNDLVVQMVGGEGGTD